jgi:hypothetical protein
MMDTADLPIWLPPLVKESARREAYAGARSAAELEMAKRITTDPRMAGVWKYLQKKQRDRRHRQTAGYKYSAIDPMAAETDHHPETFSSRAEWLQQNALRSIYRRMLHLGLLCMPSANVSIVSTGSANYYRARAAELRSEAQTLWSEDVASHLHKAANCFDAMAESSISFAVKNTPTSVMAGVARQMKHLFGTPMYTQSAIISGIVLDREVTPQQVRDSCCGLWGFSVKTSK